MRFPMSKVPFTAFLLNASGRATITGAARAAAVIPFILHKIVSLIDK
jgi:hypothetical protein